jgi:hypothetical protein
VNLETIRIALTAADIHNYQVIAGDISSANIQVETIENVYAIAGP